MSNHDNDQREPAPIQWEATSENPAILKGDRRKMASVRLVESGITPEKIVEALESDEGLQIGDTVTITTETVIELIDDEEAERDASRFMISTTDEWNIAAHDNSVKFNETSLLDIPQVDVGDIVRVALGEHHVAQIRQLGGQTNNHEVGQILPAMVIKRWGPSMMQLRVFVDGVRDLWATSVEYYSPVLQRVDPEQPHRSLLHVRAGSWFAVEEPFEWVLDPTPEEEAEIGEKFRQREIERLRKESSDWRRWALQSRALNLVAAEPDWESLHGTVTLARLGDHPDDGWRLTYYDAAEGTTTEADFQPGSSAHRLMAMWHQGELDRAGRLIDPEPLD